MPTTNIAHALAAMARAQPDAIALRIAGAPEALSYAQLDRLSDELAAGFVAIGVGAGVRTALMVRPGVAFFALMFALFRARAVPVLIDPGIERRALKACLDEAEPAAFVGIPLAHAARIALRWARASVRTLVTVGPRWGWGGWTYDALRTLGAQRLAADTRAAEPVDPDALAAILFTSGSTGVPKGVEYTHANFRAQVEMIRSAFAIAPGEVDLPTFPPFALFDPALGMTSVIPRMDFTKPGTADPVALSDTIAKHGCTTMFGSPALLDALSRDRAARGATLPTLRRVISAGAPVRPDVVERALRMLPPDARIWTPYGATECLPVAAIEGREILALRARSDEGDGICVGRPVPPNVVRIIAIDDAPIASWDDVRGVAPGEVGEITVAGPTVTRAYFNRPQATALAKIAEKSGVQSRVVHRMGDVGWFDEHGLLWYAGRKSHRVETAAGPLYTEMVEGVFNVHGQVRRTALVGVGARGAQRPVLCVELGVGVPPARWPQVRDELLAIGAANARTRAVTDLRLHPRFPVDIRHNAKIGREALARWAAKKR
jgi:acyl-CoA synthetase (AMP-forming)/AMP-acid ligase II